ncbi:RNA pseudouridylate synthase family protein [Rubellimicrobium mesophilum DSM 19309]|uniref:Pseudouridine synthase n=1 Tax=Rubellimicrobium mesophilum DSM 19309 TaxID=442562 RepID=A0A017HP30_9RHOB|nr:pseudouridine synthase [Rubellimicrobium mesophilum]EYD75928.1 RNA pseudouridylate synthase family protein [Rubellimicrobium mesophilum DSM 19309]
MSTDDNTPETVAPGDGERIAKVLSRRGVASRRDAERLILEGRVTVNGEKITSPAVNVTDKDRIAVDGEVVGAPEATRLWLYHKPAGLVTTEHDEEGRQTVFDSLPDDMPRVMSIGRLDLTSEGLLLLTNDGEVKRRLELPSTGWSRRYRVRIHGTPTNDQLEPLRQGITVEGIDYQPMEVSIDRQQGTNAWLTVTLREGKNREIRRVMEELGFTVNRLIRVSYGPFQLGELPVGDVEEVRPKIVRDQLGLGKPEPVTRSRKKPSAEDMPTFDDEPEDRPDRDRLATKRPEGATVRRELKPRTPATRKSRPEAEDAPRPRGKFGGKPALPGAFTRPKTWMRTGEEEARDRQDSPREERRTYGDKPRSSGYKSHGDRPSREGGEDRPRTRSAGFRSHSDERGDRPRRFEGDRERPSRTEGDRGPRRFGDADRPARRFDSDRPRREDREDRPYKPRPPREGGEDRPRSFKPRREAGDDRPSRPYKPRPPREGEEDRPRRAYKPREGGDDRASRPYKPRTEGDRPARGYQPRREGEDRPARFGRRPEGEDRGPRREGDDSRPSRGFKPRREGGDDRPPRSFKPRGDDARGGDRPNRFSREGEERRPPRSFGGGPRGDRADDGRSPRKGAPRDGGFKGRPGGKPRKD